MTKGEISPRSALSTRPVRSTVVALLAIAVISSAVFAVSTVWTRTVNGSADGDDVAYDVALAPNGSLYVVGAITVTDESENIWIRKYSSAGAKLWTRTVNGPGDSWERALGAAVDANNGSLYVVGSMALPGEYSDIWIRKYSSAGAKRWTRIVEGTADRHDSAQSVAVDADGNVYVVGDVTRTTGRDLWIRKYSSAGAKVWTRTVDGPSSFNDRGYGAAVDGNGNLYAVGTVFLNGQGNNIWIGKYNPSGKKQWIRTLNAPANSSDGANRAVVDANGNLYVVGYIHVSGGQRNIWIRKYSSAGAKLWTRTVDGPADSDDEAKGVDIDAVGNVYVVGYVNKDGSGDNIWIRKYNSAGAKLWTQTVSGPDDDWDEGLGITVNADGRVYVAGRLSKPGRMSDIWVRKIQQ